MPFSPGAVLGPMSCGAWSAPAASDHQGLLVDTVTGEHRPVYSSAPGPLRGFALSAIRRELYISRGPEEADIWIATIQPQ